VEQRQTAFPDNALDVPEALKLFAFRNRDLESLRTLIGRFLGTIHGELAFPNGAAVLLHGL
jgi:hypothetical protein